MDTSEKFYAGLIVFVIVFILAFFSWIVLSPKHVHSYYLSDMGGDMRIGVDIENHVDKHISVNGVTHNELIEMIKKLNATLSK